MVGHRSVRTVQRRAESLAPVIAPPPAARGRLCAYIRRRLAARSHSLQSAMGSTAPLLLLLATAAARIFRIPLDTNSTFSWTLDYAAGTVSVEVHTTAGKDHWVAVGFSDYGALEGADLCVLWRDWRGHTHLQVCFIGLEWTHTSAGMLQWAGVDTHICRYASVCWSGHKLLQVCFSGMEGTHTSTGVLQWDGEDTHICRCASLGWRGHTHIQVCFSGMEGTHTHTNTSTGMLH